MTNRGLLQKLSEDDKSHGPLRTKRVAGWMVQQKCWKQWNWQFPHPSHVMQRADASEKCATIMDSKLDWEIHTILPPIENHPKNGCDSSQSGNAIDRIPVFAKKSINCKLVYTSDDFCFFMWRIKNRPWNFGLWLDSALFCPESLGQVEYASGVLMI